MGMSSGRQWDCKRNWCDMDDHGRCCTYAAYVSIGSPYSLARSCYKNFLHYSTRMFHGESDHAFLLSKNIAAGWARVRLRAFRKLSYLKAAYRRASSRQERQRTVRSASIFDGQIFHLYHCTRNKFLSKFSHADINVQIWGKNTRAIVFTTKPHTVLFLIHCLSCSNESPKLHTSIISHTPMERKAPMFHQHFVQSPPSRLLMYHNTATWLHTSPQHKELLPFCTTEFATVLARISVQYPTAACQTHQNSSSAPSCSW